MPYSRWMPVLSVEHHEPFVLVIECIVVWGHSVKPPLVCASLMRLESWSMVWVVSFGLTVTAWASGWMSFCLFPRGSHCLALGYTWLVPCQLVHSIWSLEATFELVSITLILTLVQASSVSRANVPFPVLVLPPLFPTGLLFWRHSCQPQPDEALDTLKCVVCSFLWTLNVLWLTSMTALLVGLMSI